MSELYTPRTAVARYYVVLFSLPKWQYLTAGLLTLTVLSIIVLGTKSILIVLNASFTLITIALYRKVYRNTVFWKNKRVVGLALAVAVYTAIYTALIGDPVISVSSSTSLLTVVVLGLDGTSVFRYLLVSTPPLLTLSVSRILGLVNDASLVQGSILILVVVLIDVAIYLYMSRNKIGGKGLADIGTLFLRNWLDKKSDIEEFFETTGETKLIKPRILEFPEFLVVYTDVHYGPFSNIGSSRLPEEIQKLFSGLNGLRALPIHGLGSHDRNIVSNRYSELFLDELKRAYLTARREKILYHGAIVREHGNWRAVCLVFDKLAMVFLSRPIKGIDDLPYDIQAKFEEKARLLGLGDLVIVDSHNWELVNEEKAGDIETLEEMLDKLLEDALKLRSVRPPVEVESKIITFNSSAPGLIAGEGHLFCIGAENREEVCIVYLRGNNMKPGVRDKILEKLASVNIVISEVITNDEHSETATRAHIIYVPIHESQDLLEKIKESAKALTCKHRSKGAYYLITDVTTKLMGESAIQLEKALKISVREASILLPLYVFATPLIASLLTLFF